MTTVLPQRRRVPRNTFGARLVLLRHDLGLSQEEAADLCGVKRPTWATWEKGSIPRGQAEIARKISRATGYDLGWLLYGPEDDPSVGKLLTGRLGVRVTPQERRSPFRLLAAAS
jgi:transcriptional regulator with XRE-family HTH domain